MIHPSGLCPKSTRDISTTCKVDLALVLRASRPRTRAFAARDIDDLNPTYYDPVRATPLTVSIKTTVTDKSYKSDYKLAQSQLAVWVFAQFALLRRNFGQVPPFLPLLIVQEDQWSFFTASQSPIYGWDDKRDYETYIGEKVPIGNTRSLPGVWQICAVLQYLINWSVTQYAVWIDVQLGLRSPQPPPIATAETKVCLAFSLYFTI